MFNKVPNSKTSDKGISEPALRSTSEIIVDHKKTLLESKVCSLDNQNRKLMTTEEIVSGKKPTRVGELKDELDTQNDDGSKPVDPVDPVEPSDPNLIPTSETQKITNIELKDDVIEPSPAPSVDMSLAKNKSKKTSKHNKKLRGSLNDNELKDEVPEPSPVPSINSQENNIESEDQVDSVEQIDTIDTVDTVDTVDPVDPTPIPSVSTINNKIKDDKDDIIQPTISPTETPNVPETSANLNDVKDNKNLKDNVPEPTLTPSIILNSSQIFNDGNNWYPNGTIPPSYIGQDINQDIIPTPPFSYNFSVNILNQQKMIEMADMSGITSYNQVYSNNSNIVSYVFVGMMALLVSVGIAFYYRKRFLYTRIPSLPVHNRNSDYYEFA